MEGAKEGDMPVELETPSLQEDPNLKNALAATNPFTTPAIGNQEKQADPNSFLGRIAKRILSPLGARPPEEKKQEPPKTSESLP